jgi:arylformamidase
MFEDHDIGTTVQRSTPLPDSRNLERTNMNITDISVGLRNDLPVWPGDSPVSLTRERDIAAGDPVTVSRLECCVHSGTHVDAPSHFLAAGSQIQDLDLTVLIGPALVVEVSASQASQAIQATDLEAAGIPAGTLRLLLKSGNSGLWQASPTEFVEDFVALSPDAAEWVVDRGIGLVGIDYLSIQRFADQDPATHTILLAAGVIILEGLDLNAVAPGDFELVCLPIKLLEAEGAPARAVLISREESS